MVIYLNQLNFCPVTNTGVKKKKSILYSEDIWWKAMPNLKSLTFTGGKTVYYVLNSMITVLDSHRKISWLLFLAKGMLTNITIPERIK